MRYFILLLLCFILGCSNAAVKQQYYKSAPSVYSVSKSKYHRHVITIIKKGDKIIVKQN